MSRLWSGLRRARPNKPTETFVTALPAARLLVLLAVAQVCDDHPGRLGVRIAEVAEYTGLSASTAGHHLAALHRTGWLRRQGHRPVVYRIAGVADG